MHAIGQVLYVVLAKKNQVYPMQVIEVITKKTLTGEEIRYVLQGGSDKKSTVFLDQIDGEVFDSSERARKVLVQRATVQINKLIDISIEKAKEWYKPKEVTNVIPQRVDDLEELMTEDASIDAVQNSQTIVMPDGTIANIKLPAGI